MVMNMLNFVYGALLFILCVCGYELREEISSVEMVKVLLAFTDQLLMMKTSTSTTKALGSSLWQTVERTPMAASFSSHAQNVTF